MTRTAADLQTARASTGAPVPTPTPAPPVLRWWISDTEETRWVTLVSLVGMLAGLALVLNGGFPLDMPMPTHSFGWVEPTCGLTRGSTALIRGDFALAWRYNPASFLVVGGAVAWLVRTVVGLVSRRWLNLRVRPNAAIWIGLAVAVGALLVRQQSNAEFIINSRL